MIDDGLSTFFATPVIYFPNMDPEELQAEIDQMFLRSQATSDFVQGKLSPDEFCDVLNDSRVDPYACLDDWEEGYTYL